MYIEIFYKKINFFKKTIDMPPIGWYNKDKKWGKPQNNNQKQQILGGKENEKISS